MISNTITPNNNINIRSFSFRGSLFLFLFFPLYYQVWDSAGEERERVLGYSRVPVTRFIRLWVLVYNRVTIFNVTCTRDYKNRNHTSYNAYPQTYILLILFLSSFFFLRFLKHTLVIFVNRSSPFFFLFRLPLPH